MQKYRSTFNIAWQYERINKFIYIKDYSLNEFCILQDVAMLMWNGLMKGKSNREIVNIIQEQYDGVGYEEVEKDLEDFICDCENRGWLMKNE